MTRATIEPIPVNPADGYRLWSSTYDADPNPLLSLEFRTLAPRLDGIAGRAVLDVGCGTGRWAAFAAAAGARTIGLDISVEMLRMAATKTRLPGSLVCADALSLPFGDESADLVVCSFSLSYIAPVDALIAELARVVKRAGTVLVSDMHPAARAQGWRRTFRHGTSVFEIESHCYDRNRLLDAGLKARLGLVDVVEPRLGEPELSLMRAAGKAARIADVTAVPAVLVIEWERE
jgi:SAM-dependent methyltransferase